MGFMWERVEDAEGGMDSIPSASSIAIACPLSCPTSFFLCRRLYLLLNSYFRSMFIF